MNTFTNTQIHVLQSDMNRELRQLKASNGDPIKIAKLEVWLQRVTQAAVARHAKVSLAV